MVPRATFCNPLHTQRGAQTCPKGPQAHLDGAQLEVLARVIVDDGHEVVAQVALLVTAVLVHILGGHQGGNVEDSCGAGRAEWGGLGGGPRGAGQRAGRANLA